MVALVAIGAFGYATRRAIGIEIGAEEIRTWVQSFGWQAPFVYVFLLTFRHVLLMPSTLMLAVGGLAFGTWLGGLLGVLGLMLSGAGEFALMRTARPQWLMRHARDPDNRVSRAIERGAPMAVTLSTAIPPTPMTAFYIAAAFTALSFTSFLIAATVGSVIRSFALAYFGSGLLSADPWRLATGVALMLTLVLVPLLHPGLRERLLPPPPVSR